MPRTGLHPERVHAISQISQAIDGGGLSSMRS